MTEIVAITVGDPLMAAAFALRRDVFVVEQGIPEELEVDESDKVATHLVALSHGRVIRYASHPHAWQNSQDR